MFFFDYNDIVTLLLIIVFFKMQT